MRDGLRGVRSDALEGALERLDERGELLRLLRLGGETVEEQDGGGQVERCG